MPSFGFRMVSLPTLSALGLSLLFSQLFAGCGGEVAGPSREEVNERFCAKAVELGCTGPNECTDLVADLRSNAEEVGCASQLDALLICFSQHLTSCEVDIEDVCPAESKAYDACENDKPPIGGGNDCSVGSNGKDCRVDCADYSAECYVLANSATECRCASGPNQGLFLEADCNDIVDVAEACR